ncbi:hypothetical protein HDU90_004161 [Geranomyces variabilis]|nr:hypothetical protein HDU90_004161 [Geranomyces variabilis]
MASSNSSNSNSAASASAASATAASTPAAATTSTHHHRRTSSFGTATSFDELMASSHSSSASPLPGSAPRSRRNSLFNPLPYNPDLLDTLNFHGAARPRRPSFGGTLSLGGMDLIPSAGMMMMNEHAGAGAADSYSSVHTLETQFCKDFECCGTQFPSLHELLSHYETVHVNVKDFADFSTFSDTLFSPGGATSMMLDHHQMDLSLASMVGGPSSAKLETIQEEDAESQCSNSVGRGASVSLASTPAVAGPAGSVANGPTPSPASATAAAPATVALNQPSNKNNSNSAPVMFPSPAPSHASLPFTEIQEGIRHLHIDPSQQFAPYPPAPPPGGVAPNLVVSQHPNHMQQQHQRQSQRQPSPNSANLVVPETTVYMPSSGKRSRAPSLVAMNLPPDEVKKIRSLDGNYHSGASGTSGDESVPSPSLSHASAPDTPRASHNGSTVHHNNTNGADQIMTDAMISAMQGHSLPTADFFPGQQQQQQQQQPRGSPMLGGARPLAQPHPRAHPATAAHQQQLHHAFSQNTSVEPTVGVSPHLAHLHSPFDLPSAPQGQGQAFPRSGTPGLMISHDRPHFQVEPPPPRPSSTPVMVNAGHLGGQSPLQQHQQLHHQHPHQQHQRHPPTSTPPNGWMSASDGQDMQAFVDEVYGLAPGGAQGGGGKRYKCPRAFCSKVYKNSNGLKYHLEHGNCELDYAQGQQSGQQQQQQQQAQHGEYPAAAPSHPDFAPFADMASPPSQPLQPPQQQQQQQQHPAGNGTPPPAHAPPPQFINPNVASGPYVTSPMMHAAVAGSSSSSASSSPLMPPHIIPVYHGTPMHHHQQHHPHHPQHPQHPQIQHQQHQLHMLQQQHPGLHAQQQQQLAMHYAHHPHPQHHPHMQAMAGMGYPIVAQDIKIALRPYWCRQCPKKYKNLNGLKYHAKVAHADLDFKTQVKGHTSMNL